MQVIDLHCDLLSYVGLGVGRIDEPEAHCSLPQLKEGNVALQVMALYTETDKHSTLNFQKQVDAYLNLEALSEGEFSPLKKLKAPPQDGKVYTLAAIENASGLALEDEPLEVAFRRLEECLDLCSPLLYVSLTWNDENRFGGGNRSFVGLKEDGKLLLEYLSGKRVAIDLSHASDQLAEDILNTIEKDNLHLIPIASHSNFRHIQDNPRNLPDHLAEAIISKGGMIGMNFYRPFIGKTLPDDFFTHILYAKEKGWINSLCFGADFFFEKQIKHLLPSLFPYFAPPMEDATCYPVLIELLKMYLTKEELEGLAHQNVTSFFKRLTKKHYAYSR